MLVDRVRKLMGLPRPSPFILGITGYDNLTGYFLLSVLMESDFARVDVFFGQVSWFALELKYGANYSKIQPH